MVLLVALKQHGNHGSTPGDWPLQRKWKSQRKDLKIPWANKEVILQIYCSKVETRICSSVGEVCWFTQDGASTEHNAWQNWFSAALCCNTVHRPESPQGRNNSLWSSRQFPSACSFEVPERQRQVWEIPQCLSTVVQWEAKERYDIFIWIHSAWIKVLLLTFCHLHTGTSEDQLSFKGVS